MAGLEKKKAEFDDAGVRIVALSADGEQDARKMKAEEALSFPVPYGLDVDEMRDRIGLYVEKGVRTHVQPAQFVLDAEGHIYLACYQSGKLGRLGAAEALDMAKEAAESEG